MADRNKNTFVAQQKAVANLQKRLPAQVGTIAVRFFKHNFKRQGFLDDKLSKWQPRKNDDKGRNLLIKSGDLRRSIRVIQRLPNKIRIGTDVAYAAIHNEGGTISGRVSVRSHTRKGRNVRAHNRNLNFKIPKRQFMGNSKALQAQIENHIQNKLSTIFN